MTIQIEYEAEREWKVDYRPIIEEIVVAALDYEKCPYEAEVNVVLTNDEEIHRINKEFRGIDRATDVLSFPMGDYDVPSDFERLEEQSEDYFNPETGELLLGDIVISIDKVDEQAEKYGHSKERELAFLVAHSMLHLCGYDHMEDDERLVMEKKQEEILAGTDSDGSLLAVRLFGSQRNIGNGSRDTGGDARAVLKYRDGGRNAARSRAGGTLRKRREDTELSDRGMDGCRKGEPPSACNHDEQ